MIYHDEANRILDLPTKKEQVEEWKKLPDYLRFAVGDLMRISNKANEHNRHLAWRIYRDGCRQ